MQKKHCHLSIIILLPIFIGLLSSCSSDFKVKISPKEQPENSNFSVDVFIENSGSMNGYMTNGSEFRDATYSYLTSLNSYSDTMRLNYINSEIINLNIKLNNYVDALTPTAFAHAGGNTANSNFKDILTNVINKVNDNNVVVFVSDCILDIPKGQASEFLNITKTDINNIINEKIKQMPSLSFCIYQLESQFDGIYFPPRGGKIKYKGKRPYYMWIIGSQQNLAYILKNIPDKKIQHGIKNYCAFAPSYKIPTTLISGGKPNDEIVVKTSKNGMRPCQIEMDLSHSLQKDEYLTNIENFYTNKNSIFINSIHKLNKTDNFTHILNIDIDDKAFSDFIYLKSVGIPLWVKKHSGNNDTEIENEKTFSLEYIIGGIADAYDKHKEVGKTIITTYKN